MKYLSIYIFASINVFTLAVKMSPGKSCVNF